MKKENIGSRRAFIKGAALFGGLAVWLGAGRPRIIETKPPLPRPGPSGQGYRLTEHVKQYYETARA